MILYLLLISGETGFVGSPGDAGLPGLPGQDGLKGQQGFPGTDGLNGSPGREGPAGEPGLSGLPGYDGKYHYIAVDLTIAANYFNCGSIRKLLFICGIKCIITLKYQLRYVCRIYNYKLQYRYRYQT